MTQQSKILPDWTTPKELVVVDPTKLRSKIRRTDRSTLLPFLLDFTKLIHDKYKGDLTISMVTPEKPDLVLSAFNYIELECRDIWIRDWAPINVQDEDGTNSLIKAIYEPSYCLGNTAVDDEAGKILQLKYINNLRTLPIRWDGGNITTNGEILICTDRIFKENALYSRYEIEQQIRTRFEFKQLIIIPTENLDVVGHIDGIIRFIDEKTVLVPNYPNYYYEECRYIDKVISELVRQLPNINIVHIPSELSEYVNKENIYSAVGSYLNYLRLDNQIYVPQYDIHADILAIDIFEKNAPEGVEIIPVKIEGIHDLADFGGVLNCCTWVRF